mmetsp:Transcript_24237/g.43753  ORF Transcript_24237/g.43753 Transcript_24237/m.43753 type:complete len:245 (+) Transcript_24237:498-1232(+)
MAKILSTTLGYRVWNSALVSSIFAEPLTWSLWVSATTNDLPGCAFRISIKRRINASTRPSTPLLTSWTYTAHLLCSSAAHAPSAISFNSVEPLDLFVMTSIPGVSVNTTCVLSRVSARVTVRRVNPCFREDAEILSPTSAHSNEDFPALGKPARVHSVVFAPSGCSTRGDGRRSVYTALAMGVHLFRMPSRLICCFCRSSLMFSICSRACSSCARLFCIIGPSAQAVLCTWRRTPGDPWLTVVC